MNYEDATRPYTDASQTVAGVEAKINLNQDGISRHSL